MNFDSERFCQIFRCVAGPMLSRLMCPDEYKPLFSADESLLIQMETGTPGAGAYFMDVLGDTLIIMYNGEEGFMLDTSVGFAGVFGCGNRTRGRGGNEEVVEKYLNGGVEGKKGAEVPEAKRVEEEETKEEPRKEEPKEEPKKEETEEKEENSKKEEPEEPKDDLSGYFSFKNSIKSYIDTVTGAFSKLYSSGYGFGTRVGLLTTEGVVTCTAEGERLMLGEVGERMLAIKLFKALRDCLGENYSRFSQPDEEPTLAGINSGSKVYLDVHLKAMFGYFAFCKGRTTGLRAYLTKKNIPHDNDKGAKKWEHVRGWMNERVEEYFLKAIRESGIPPYVDDGSMLLSEYSDRYEGSVENVCKRIADTLKSAFVVTQRQVKKSDGSLINYTIRIPSYDSVAIDDVSASILKIFNVGGSEGVGIEASDLGEGVYEFKVIFDKKAFSQDMLFAHMMLDTLQEQGIKPSWASAVLGRDMEENLFQYNFKNDKNFFICMYGSSGSGKGVMTMNLLASALADNCFVTYMDAKPDTSVALAKTVWNKGKDGMIYSGPGTNPTYTLETSGGCPRSSDRFISKNYIPESMFGSDVSGLNSFIEITLYYRGLELILDLCEQRYAVFNKGGSGEVKNGSWMVSVFDELQKVASEEKLVRDKVKEIKKARKEAKEQYTDAKGNKKERKIDIYSDPVYLFATDWENWLKDIANKFTAGCKATFRQAEVTFIFIWQTNTFPGSDVDTCALAKALSDSSGAAVKMIGRGALKLAKDGGSTTWGTPSCSWYDTKFSGEKGGYWAVGGDPFGNMSVFKPYNVYSGLDRDRVVSNARDNGLSEEDLVGIALHPDGSIIEEIALDGYANRLLGMYGMDPATQLQMCRTYVENFVVESGRAANLDDYMYNFKGHTSGADGDMPMGASAVPLGIKYNNDNGAGAKTDYSNPQEAFNEADDDLARKFNESSDSGREEFDEPMDEDEIPDFWDDEQVEDNGEGLDLGGLGKANEDGTITMTEEQLQDILDRYEQYLKRSGSGVVGGSNSFDGMPVGDNGMPDYVKQPVTRVATMDLGKDIGSINFDADDITCTGDLMTKVTNAAYAVYGDFSTWQELRVIDDGTLVINRHRFDCKLDVRYASAIPYDIRIKVNSGQVASMFNFGTLYAMNSLQYIECSSQRFFSGYIAPQIGSVYVGSGDTRAIVTLFENLRNLRFIRIGKTEYTREKLSEYRGMEKNFSEQSRSREEELTWGMNAFFAKNFRKSKDLASATMRLGKDPTSSSACQRFLANHGLIRTGVKAVGLAGVGVHAAVTGLGAAATNLTGRAMERSRNSEVRQGTADARRQSKAFVDGLRDLWNN